MIENKYIGFISNKTIYKDNDAIFNVITKDSYETFKARGISKITSKNSSSCNYFMISEFVTNSKTQSSNQTLKSSSIIKMYKKPYEDIFVSSSYLFICNLLNQLKEQINGYEVAIKCFDLLEQNVYAIDVLNYFLKQVINTLGFKPNLKGCVNCSKSKNLISFDFESGGFICNDCYNDTLYEVYPSSFLKQLYDFLKSDDLISLPTNRSLKIFNMYCDFLKKSININIEAKDFILKCM